MEQIAYETGDIQIAVKPTAETCQKYSDEATYLTKLSTMCWVVDCQDDVLQDPRVRQALSMAIDRQALCDMLGGGETPAYSIVPKTEMDYSADEYFVDVYDPYFSESVEEAQALLAEAGYPDGAASRRSATVPAAARNMRMWPGNLRHVETESGHYL